MVIRGLQSHRRAADVCLRSLPYLHTRIPFPCREKLGVGLFGSIHSANYCNLLHQCYPLLQPCSASVQSQCRSSLRHR